MPLFEFECSECGQPFEELVRSANAVNEVICPFCGGERVNKKISTFAAKIAGGGSRSSSSFSNPAACSTGSL
jgi:putative FmdB family regulatory protein